MHSYLHHHFPATDIPAPARDLLQKKHVRQIPDVEAEAVDIVPYINATTAAPTNIILSELRNPSEIHLEYLKNMGVSATLSFSIMVRGKLWGLITCHNLSPVFIDYWKRQLCYLIAKAFSNAVMAGHEKRDIGTLEHYKQIEEQLIQQMSSSDEVVQGLFYGKHTLLDITEGAAAAVFIHNKLTRSEFAPEECQVMEIIDWLVANSNNRVFSTRQLSKVMPGAVAFQDKASGLLALEISRYNKEYILYFKPEIRETRIWAGNPEKPERGADKILHPRKSFQNWEEVIKGKSLPWTMNELEITEILLKDITTILLRNQAQQLNQLNLELKVNAEDLRTKNSRLEDFTNIITHNLRSPLRNIRGLHKLYMAEPTQDVAAEVMARISGMADNLSATIDDLNLILKATIEKPLPQGDVPIESIIETEKQNLQDEILQSNAKFVTDLSLKTLSIPKVYLESILHNLISNALKYKSNKRQPLITIKAWQDEQNSFLSVSDNGLGMDLEKVGARLFMLYKTFHHNKNSKGLGLYLTKMQIEGLGGHISVESEPDKGTTFLITLPNVQ
ncbi:ATP-binding protein [Pontibacter rugosus]